MGRGMSATDFVLGQRGRTGGRFIGENNARKADNYSGEKGGWVNGSEPQSQRGAGVGNIPRICREGRDALRVLGLAQLALPNEGLLSQYLQDYWEVVKECQEAMNQTAHQVLLELLKVLAHLIWEIGETAPEEEGDQVAFLRNIASALRQDARRPGDIREYWRTKRPLCIICNTTPSH